MQLLIHLAPALVILLILWASKTKLPVWIVVIGLLIGWAVSFGAAIFTERVFRASLPICQMVFGLFAPAGYSVLMIIGDRMTRRKAMSGMPDWSALWPAIVGAIIQAAATIFATLLTRR